MTSETNVLRWGAAELAAHIRAKDISAREYAATLQKQCVAHESLGGYITQDFDALMAQAKRADEKLVRDPASCGPLHGVPIALKDNIDTVDLPTSGGTLALKGYTPPKNAPVWQRLADAGALLAGKANMHELASGGSNDNLAVGRAKNPFDRSRTPGGSSGGSGVVLAARLAPAALGSDTAGSVRVPASLCGVVGLRPSHGRYSNDGVIPLAPSRDTVGPMARSVADVALLDGFIAGESSPLPPMLPRSLRLGVDRARFFPANADAAVLAVIETALADLQRAGVELVDVSVEPDRALSNQVSGAIFEAELIVGYDVYLKSSALHMTMASIHAQIQSPSLKARWAERLAKPAMPNPAAYRKALSEDTPLLRAAHERIMQERDLDALVAPTAPQAALPFGGDDNVMIGAKSISSWLYFVNTAYAPVRGLPSLSLPAGATPEGLPVGLLLEGRAGADRALLGVGKAVESVLGVVLRPLLAGL